jgi:hypothetical protein
MRMAGGDKHRPYMGISASLQMYVGAPLAGAR